MDTKSQQYGANINNQPKKKKVQIDCWNHDGARCNLQEKRGWKASIIFTQVILVPNGEKCTGKKFLAVFARNHRPSLDICSYIGSQGGPEAGGRCYYYRIYFNPTEFPPPRKGLEDGAFEELKSRIRAVSKESGSPVFCNGGNGAEKTFTCAHNSRNKRGNSSHCPFRFTVRWDKHGYYVHLKDLFGMRVQSSGCPWHLCNGC